MALAYSIKSRDVAGSQFLRVVDITLDNSYPTGGWALAVKSLGLGTNGVIKFLEVPGSEDGYILQYDEVNTKLKVFQGDNANAAAGPATELPNASAVMNGKVVRVKVQGTGSPG